MLEFFFSLKILFSHNTDQKLCTTEDKFSTDEKIEGIGHIENDFYKYLSNENAEENDKINSIIIEKPKKNNNINSNHNIQNAFEPKLDEQQIDATRTFVSLYLDSNALTWVRFKLNDNDISVIHIDKWQYNKLVMIKKNLHEIIDEMVKFVNEIPDSDTYVMEKHLKKMATVTAKSATSLMYSNQRIISLVLLLTKKYQQNHEQSLNNFYFMPHFLMGRLFELIIGNEITSTQKATEGILKNVHLNNANNLYQISFDETLRKQYFSASSVEREFLGRTMLLGLSFYRLAIFKCPDSINAIKKKKI